MYQMTHELALLQRVDFLFLNLQPNVYEISHELFTFLPRTHIVLLSVTRCLRCRIVRIIFVAHEDRWSHSSPDSCLLKTCFRFLSQFPLERATFLFLCIEGTLR